MLKKTPDQGKTFVYRDTDESVYKERSEQTTGALGDSIFRKGFDIYRVGQGENCIRILPRTWDTPNHYGYDVYVHSFVGINRGSYLCLLKMKNRPCPICEAVSTMQNSGEEEEAKKAAARRRVIYWVVNRNLEKGKRPWPSLFNTSPTMDRDISAMTHTKRGHVAIHRINDGRDVIFQRRGQGLNTEYYGFQLDTEASPVHEDRSTQQQMLDFIENNPIPSLLVFQKPEYLKMIMEGTVEEKDEELDDTDQGSEEQEARQFIAEHEDETEEEAPKKPARARGNVRAEEEPEFDEEDEDGKEPPWEDDADEEAFEEEEKPKASVKRMALSKGKGR